MRILITGARGQLGSELCRCFERGYTELGTPEVLKQQNEVTAADTDELDISDKSAVERFFAEKRFDTVINCAAFTNVNGCESDPDAAFRANSIGAANLAAAAENIGAELIHISTDYVFPGDAKAPYREWDICCPQSVYGKSKLLGEQYVREFCKRYYIVRTAWLYGYTGNNFVKTMIKINREKGECRVVDDQFGNPTNAADLAHHVLKLIGSGLYGVYHGTGNGVCSWYEFAKAIVEFAGISSDVKPCATEEYPTPARRPAYSALENMMFGNTVGDEFRDWQTALKAFFENNITA